jgi:hypothetical protein
MHACIRAEKAMTKVLTQVYIHTYIHAGKAIVRVYMQAANAGGTDSGEKGRVVD